MGKRGRPFNSEIRNNVLTILFYLGEGYGYEISKLYNKIFPKVTMRSVYYHLKKGISLGEIKMKEVKQEHGDYSWGTTVEKIYYSLGDKANPKDSEKAKKVITDYIKARS
jgi:hypothetical protein